MCIDIVPILTLIVAIATLLATIVTCIFAFFIPKRIMLNQLFADLCAEYRTPEMGGAIFALFSFYDKCKGNINNEYINIYESQIQTKLNDNGTITDADIKFANTLHFQRRRVAQFYADMADLYNKKSCNLFLRKKIRKWLTKNELQLLKIILLLDQPASKVFIKVDVPEPIKNEVKMYKSIRSFYKKIKKHIN